MDSAIMAANEKQDFVTQEWEERDLYLRRQMAIMDYNSGMDGARREGRMEAQLEIARNALANELPIEVIQKITGLSLDEIEKL